MSATASEAMAAADEPEVVEPKEEKKKSKKRFKIAGMKINSLRSIAKHFGLGGKGKKKELIDRIEESDVGIDDIKEIAGSELLDSPDKRRYKVICIRMRSSYSVDCSRVSIY